MAVYNESVAEAASAADTLSAAAIFASSISESAPAVDTVSAAVNFAVSVSEAAAAVDVTSARVDFMVSISEAAPALDGNAATVVSGPLRLLGLLPIDPRFMEFPHWAAMTGAMLRPFGFVPLVVEEGGWRDWAELVASLPIPPPLIIPSPKLYEEWQDWAYRLNETILRLGV